MIIIIIDKLNLATQKNHNKIDKKMIQNITIITLCLFSLSSCLPAAFTAASSSAMAVAKDRTVGETWTDAKIAAKIKANFIKQNFKELYTKIHIEVVEGRVLYTGIIDNEEEALTAMKIAWDQEGVKQVINELKIDKESNYFNLGQYTKDCMATTQIKTKIFANREIKFVNYTVITLNNIVYLFGIARSSEELEKVANIAATTKGVEKVISHVRIKEVPEKTNYKDA